MIEMEIVWRMHTVFISQQKRIRIILVPPVRMNVATGDACALYVLCNKKTAGVHPPFFHHLFGRYRVTVNFRVIRCPRYSIV